jgi:hypothetical protein
MKALSFRTIASLSLANSFRELVSSLSRIDFESFEEASGNGSSTLEEEIP